MADIPEKLGKYEIRRELGRGAMGIVYEGWDPMIARRVALKTVRKEQLESSEADEMLSRFKREAQAAGRLNHPNVVAVYEYGEEADGTAFIAMEYVEGRELKDYFDRQERFPMAEIVRIMGEILDALGHAHAHGITHRDIKPANIFVLASGQAKVGDFGIARIESSNLTQAGSVLGTPAYMSPEQFMGQTVDGRSDLFSAGVILYQFLTGEKPFAGQLTTIMHKVLKEDPIAPSELNVTVPTVFDAVIRKAMAKRPADRYQSAREFTDGLRAAAQWTASASDDATVVHGAADGDATVVHQPEATVAYTPPPAAPQAAPVQALPPRQAISRPEPPPPPPGGPQPPVGAGGGLPKWAIAAGVGALALVGGGIALFGGKSPPPAPPGPATVAVAPAPAPEVSTNTMTISAVGLADSSDPRFAADPNLLRTTLRDETKRNLVEKAVALYVQSNSLAEHYGVLRDKLLAHSGDFIEAVIQEDAPQTGQDGLVSMTAKATVRIRDVQKSLNQMSKDERVEIIRNNGDPRIAVAIATLGAAEGAQPQRSQIAENVLKEKVQSFGFRTWAEDGGDKKADFKVQGEVKFRKLSVKLEASGLNIERTVITSWTIKCLDTKSGEEIYFNTTIPQKVSWNSEDEALADLGRLIGEEFSKNFFLQHFHFTAQHVQLKLSGLPDETVAKRLLTEVAGLRSVLALTPVKTGGETRLDLDLAGNLSNLSDLVSAGVATPLNRKFGRACFNVTSTAGSEVSMSFDPACKDPAVLTRLDSTPPAALYEAPTAKRQAIVKNPELLRKLEI